MGLKYLNMKKLYYLIFLIPLLNACIQAEDVNSDHTPADKEVGVFSFEAQIVSPESLAKQEEGAKTALGEKYDGKYYPNYWVAGDAISVNGITSDPLASDSEYVGTNKARFDVQAILEAPYYFAYPASVVSAYSSGCATITLPEKQEWISTTYDATAYLMMGKSDANVLEFVPMMSVIRLNVPKGTSDAKIRSITFMSLGDEKVSGDFTTDFLTLTPTNALPYVHVMAPDSGAEFGSDVYLLIPAQTYAKGMVFAIRATDGTTMTYTTRNAFTASAGKLYPLTTKAYTPDPDPMMVMSSNVRFASASKKDENPDTGDRAWVNRRGAYYSMLNAMRPCVVGLQEAEKEQVVDIKNNCSGYAHIGWGRESGKDITSDFSTLGQLFGKDHGESTTILYRTDKVSVQSSGWFCHSETPNKADTYFSGTEDKQPRISTWAVMTYIESGRQFFFLNTHTTLYASVQAKEIELVLSKVKELNPTGLPVILTGDWNLQETDEIMQPVLSTYLSARGTAAVTDNHNTYHWWGTMNEKKLDHIFYNGFESCHKYCTMIQMWEGKWISDHHPVYALLDFNNVYVPLPSNMEAGASHEDYNSTDLFL